MPAALPFRTLTSRHRRLPMQPSGLLRLIIALPRAWTRCSERHRQRQALAELDDRMLEDIGLTRRQAERECGKPPWR